MQKAELMFLGVIYAARLSGNKSKFERRPDHGKIWHFNMYIFLTFLLNHTHLFTI